MEKKCCFLGLFLSGMGKPCHELSEAMDDWLKHAPDTGEYESNGAQSHGVVVSSPVH